MDFAALRRYARVRRNDIVAAVVAAVGVLAFGPLYGLLLAVAGLGARPGLPVEPGRRRGDGQGAAREGGLGRHPRPRGAADVPGVLVLRIDAPIFWVTAAPVHDAILAQVESAPATSRRSCSTWRRPTRWTRPAPTRSPTCWPRCASAGIDLYLVRVMWPVRKVLRRSGLMAELGEDHLWHSISQGVREARRAHGLERRPRPTSPTPTDDVAEEHIVARSPGRRRSRRRRTRVARREPEYGSEQGMPAPGLAGGGRMSAFTVQMGDRPGPARAAV